MELHFFFLPMLMPGHMIPMVDTAVLLARRSGVKCTIVTTPANADSIRPTIPECMGLLTVPFPASDAGLPEGIENVTALPMADVTPPFLAGLAMMEAPFRALVEEHVPDCIVSDIYFPWTASLAAEFGIPRILFQVIGTFALVIQEILIHIKPHKAPSDEDEPFFTIPVIPHRINITSSELPPHINISPADGALAVDCFGMIINSFSELGPEYADYLKHRLKARAWHIGPVSLCHQEAGDKTIRGSKATIDCDECLKWLDEQKHHSVLYICFGSLGRFIETQLRELAAGIEAAGHPFLWVLKECKETEWLPRKIGRGIVVKGWAPQMLLLHHPAVGGFMTHCGWNSFMEGLTAGLPMITWPLFAEQFINQRLAVDVLNIGLEAGNGNCSFNPYEWTLVSKEWISEVVSCLMGDGKEAEKRRTTAKEMAEKAKKAVDLGGSSYNDITRLIKEVEEMRRKNNVRK